MLKHCDVVPGVVAGLMAAEQAWMLTDQCDGVNHDHAVRVGAKHHRPAHRADIDAVAVGVIGDQERGRNTKRGSLGHNLVTNSSKRRGLRRTRRTETYVTSSYNCLRGEITAVRTLGVRLENE